MKEIVMKKAEFLTKLHGAIRSYSFQVRGSAIFARFFDYWLTNFSIPSDEKYDFFQIEDYLPQLAMDAWEEMRTNKGQWALKCRIDFEAETGRGLSNIMELDGGNILDKNADSFIVEDVLRAALGNDSKVPSEFGHYCRAQSVVLQGLFDQFLRRVYRKGLFEIILLESTRGMKGVFGPTELRTYVIAGRTMFTFARPKKKGIEVSVSFVAGDDDSLALEAGIQSVQANLATAYNMIEDVISRWPEDTRSQVRLFKPDPKVQLG